jgi:hypothetical protein
MSFKLKTLLMQNGIKITILLIAFNFNSIYGQQYIEGKYNPTADKFTAKNATDHIINTSEGFSRFYVGDGMTGMGLINKEGKIICTPIYNNIMLLADTDSWIYMKAGLYGMFDKKDGKQLLEPKYHHIDPINDKVYTYQMYSKWGLLDTLGNTLTEPLFDKIHNFKEGFARFYLDNKCGFINTKGEIIVAAKYQNHNDMFFSEGLARVGIADKFGFVDTSANEVVAIKYDYASKFTNGLARVKLNNKWGFVDKKGNVTIPIKYDAVWVFEDNKALVVSNKIPYYINKKGVIIRKANELSNVEITNDLISYDQKNTAVSKKNSYSTKTTFN